MEKAEDDDWAGLAFLAAGGGAGERGAGAQSGQNKTDGQRRCPCVSTPQHQDKTAQQRSLLHMSSLSPERGEGLSSSSLDMPIPISINRDKH